MIEVCSYSDKLSLNYENLFLQFLCLSIIFIGWGVLCEIFSEDSKHKRIIYLGGYALFWLGIIYHMVIS